VTTEVTVNGDDLREALRSMDAHGARLKKSEGEWRRKRSGSKEFNQRNAESCAKRWDELKQVYDRLDAALSEAGE
jgi:hypothetical protein